MSINFSESEKWIIGIICAFISSIFIAWFSHLLSIKRDKLIIRRDAEKLIADTFTSTLEALIKVDGDSGIILTDNIFHKHESVIKNNIRRLSWFQQIRLRYAWNKFAYYRNYYNFQYGQYMDYGSLDKRKLLKPLAVSRIQKIISIVS